MKNYYKECECWYNRDGEFGQKTGWLVKKPYMAEIGGMTAVNLPIAEVYAKATATTSNYIVLTGCIQISTVRQHGYDIWANDAGLYKVVD
jgi:hypothetical protein